MFGKERISASFPRPATLDVTPKNSRHADTIHNDTPLASTSRDGKCPAFAAKTSKHHKKCIFIGLLFVALCRRRWLFYKLLYWLCAACRMPQSASPKLFISPKWFIPQSFTISTTHCYAHHPILLHKPPQRVQQCAQPADKLL